LAGHYYRVSENEMLSPKESEMASHAQGHHEMMKSRNTWLLTVVVVIVVLSAPVMHAQPALDRVVGSERSGGPLVITGVNGQAMGQLAAAAGVPFGFEAAPAQPNPRAWAITATGKKLRDVLAALVAIDPRYEWREDNDVIVLRPVSAWSDIGSVLQVKVAALALTDVTATDALNFIANLFGGKGLPSWGPGDTKRFSVELPAGSTVLDVLNAIVRAHGTLAWALEPSRVTSPEFPVNVTLFVGAEGSGRGIRFDAIIETPPDVRGQRRRDDTQSGILERIVGTREDGQPLVVLGVFGSSLPQLAVAAQVPMGLETPAADRFPQIVRRGFEGIRITGLTLRDALDAIISLDPRYEWREFDGVIVLRPATAWLDPLHPLFQLVTNLRLDDVPASKAIGAFAALFGGPGLANFPDTRRFSVEVGQGSGLDVLNAIVRSHGEMSWHWKELSASEQRAQPFSPKKRYEVTFWVFGGGGRGVLLP
jgi:hypothetical protein